MRILSIQGVNPRGLPSHKGVGRRLLSAALTRACLLLLLCPVILPLLWLLISWSDIDVVVWQHLFQTQLFKLVVNTGALLITVGCLASFLGVISAWFVVQYDVPGRRHLEWLLVLPLAMPAYVLAFVIEGWLGVGGVGFQLCKALVPLSCQVPAVFKASITLSLVLYPYVFLLARVAFMQQGPALFSVSRTLGLNERSVFWRLGLPLARPATMAGLALVLMEVAADFGAVSVFNYDTFTTAVYKTWFGFFSLSSAAQLASLLMLGMFILVFVERLSRQRIRYEADTYRQTSIRELGAWGRVWVGVSLWGLVVAAFMLPVLQLVFWAAKAYEPDLIQKLWVLLERTSVLAAIASGVIMLGVGALLYCLNGFGSRWRQFCLELSTMGYAVPGTVLAVAVMLLLNQMDHWLNQQGLLRGQAWWVGGIAGLLVAYWVRFLSVALRPIQTSLAMISDNLVAAAKSLGASKWQVWWRLYLPLAFPGLATGFFAVFVEVAKEMPATLLLRPFGWDTLAVNIYELTSEGEWYRAAWPGLTLVMLGLVPVYLLIRRTHQQHAIAINRGKYFE